MGGREREKHGEGERDEEREREMEGGGLGAPAAKGPPPLSLAEPPMAESPMGGFSHLVLLASFGF
jgi:hypothetical protein